VGTDGVAVESPGTPAQEARIAVMKRILLKEWKERYFISKESSTDYILNSLYIVKSTKVQQKREWLK
jgi:hypothetical protein